MCKTKAEDFPSHLTNNTDVDWRAVEDKKITKDNLKLVLAGIENNKTLGLHGLPREFYKQFFNIVPDDLCDVFSEIASNSYLPPSMFEVVTVLFPKKRDEQDLKSLLFCFACFTCNPW